MPTIYEHADVRLEALPHRRKDRHPVRSTDARRPGDDDRQRRGHGDVSARRPSSFPRDLDGLRVLVVDDDPDILELFEAALTECGAQVTCSTTARDALARMSGIQPDVVVSDIAMVGEDGYWLVRELRRLPAEALRDVPVIAATAYGREHPRSAVLAAGFTEHLQKPVDPDALCRLVARLAGR
jgi:CheY-like chemotaxis protein